MLFSARKEGNEMRKRSWIAAVALVFAVALSVILCSSSSLKAQEKTAKDWSHVTVVSYPSGLTGFFDAKTGKLYLYDSNLENCFVIRQLTELGQPAKKIKN